MNSKTQEDVTYSQCYVRDEPGLINHPRPPHNACWSDLLWRHAHDNLTRLRWLRFLEPGATLVIFQKGPNDDEMMLMCCPAGQLKTTYFVVEFGLIFTDFVIKSGALLFINAGTLLLNV